MEDLFFTKSVSIFYMPEETEIAKLLHAEINKRNLSLRDAARQIGISHPTLGLILNGEKPSFDSVKKIAPFLHVSLEMALRMSGLLPKINKTSQLEEKLLFIFENLDEDKKQGLLDYAEFLLRKEP